MGNLPDDVKRIFPNSQHVGPCFRLQHSSKGRLVLSNFFFSTQSEPTTTMTPGARNLKGRITSFWVRTELDSEELVEWYRKKLNSMRD